MASSASTEHESSNLSSRLTKDGRKISYRLTVIQQPVRARACGQGAKSSSDRRPVDPPPIVELRVFEGEQQHDITIPYNASFFLFATLEPAPKPGSARASQASQSGPLLTGTPVAGISYLDRPTPAAYFIFPDLSVRHEGEYRLSFGLFEELKEPRDVDADSHPIHVASEVHNRCEVKSASFHVFSAKKFPGLEESTLLSRLVADQGCRVRIRRDVRLRRRDSKPGKDWDEKPEDLPASDPAPTEPPPSATYETKPATTPVPPGDYSERMQPSSNTATVQAPQEPAQPMPQQAQADYSYQQQWYGMRAPDQQVPQQSYSQQSPTEQAYTPQYAQQQYTTPHSQPMAQYPQYQGYSYSQSQPSPMVPAQYQYIPQQQPMYASQQPHHQSYNTIYSPTTTDRPEVYSNQTSPTEPSYPQHHQHHYDPNAPPPQQAQPGANVPLANGKSLPPMEVPRVSHTTSAEGLVSSSSPRHPGGAVPPPSTTMGPPSQHSQSPSYSSGHSQQPPPSYSSSQPPAYASSQPGNYGYAQPTSAGYEYKSPAGPYMSNGLPPTPTQAYTHVGTKRSYATSFGTQHEEALRNGARPEGERVPPVPDWSDNSDEDWQPLEPMCYRRADGSWTTVTPRQYPTA